MAAGELREGEGVSTAGGDGVVESVGLLPGTEPVYNIEVDGQHCFRVGEQGLLVHNASAAETARLHPLFQPMIDPIRAAIAIMGLTDRQLIDRYLPPFNEQATNPTYGLLIANGSAYGLQSGLAAGLTAFGDVTFRRESLSTVDIECTTIDFNNLEPHVEAVVSAFMIKHGITSALLYINATNPCLGETGCSANLPHMLPFGARLRVVGTSIDGTYIGG